MWQPTIIRSRGSVPISFLLIAGGCPTLAAAQPKAVERPTPLKLIEVKEADGQILSYRHLAGSTEVRMRGTKLAAEARIRLKVGTRPGFTEIDINRGDITKLMPAQQFGRDFLTYVLWAVSVDGKASNLGEITFEGDKPISINITTPYQTFWLMLTAEPDYAVVDPSPQVILYSINQGASSEPAGNKPLPIKRDLFYFTHYTAYDSSPATLERVPNELLQARKAVELASKSGILATSARSGLRGREEERTRQTLEQARSVLEQAEDAFRKNPQAREVVQFARTAAQIAENARALAGGAVGDALLRQLEDELAGLRGEFAKLQGESSKLRTELATLLEERAKTPKVPAKGPAATPAQAKKEDPPSEPPDPPSVVSKPVVWFGVVGWVLALLLLFRRRGI